MQQFTDFFQPAKVAVTDLRGQVKRLRHDPDNPVQWTPTAQFTQRGVFFLIGLSSQTAAVNQKGTVAFKPLVFLQAWNQFFNRGFVARHQQQVDFVAP